MLLVRKPSFLLLLFLACAALVQAGEGRTGLPVCPKPADRCDVPQKNFEPHELPFRLPKRLGDNVLYESAPFYAVVLRKDRGNPPCDGGEFSLGLERFRRDAQKRFPERKVFADHQCPDMAAVSYAFADARPNEKNSFDTMVAVYAGRTEAEARAVYKKARTHFPQASLRRMRVSFSRIVQ
jgi:hypothetical protein